MLLTKGTLLPSFSRTLTLPTKTLMNIAENLNQPITAFLSASPIPSNDPKIVAFNVRWFTSTRQEIALCGHGTLAAAKGVFDRDDVAEDIEAIEFHTLTRGVMTARRRQGGFIEIELPEVVIGHIASGVGAFEKYLLVVLDEEADLGNLSVDATPLRESGFEVHVFTTQISNGNERFVSRMFAPGYVAGDEDHVCGSAHCVMAPYWYNQLEIASGQEIKARQVSRRGGDLKLMWESEKNILRLSGEVALLGKGEVILA
ncbi:hypothetical protein FPV67DRAFT_1648599 [Lyophyllum atratum]|nr:hypothetical protein FPV67DRAFT_1648599 [Lyophyllum atratum]